MVIRLLSNSEIQACISRNKLWNFRERSAHDALNVVIYWTKCDQLTELLFIFIELKSIS